MENSEFTFRAATVDDVDTLIELMHGMQRDDPWSVQFCEDEARKTLGELLATPTAGRMYVITLGGRSAGYLVLSFDFSLEYRGKNAWIDELFVAREFRGKGAGSAAVNFAIEESRALGAKVLHLEVNRGNPAIELYKRHGFEEHDRYLLSKWLVPKP
jgi:diamine N-acetyltransferase